MALAAEPVAITAMAGIFPGAPDLEAYWGRILRAEPAPLGPLDGRWGGAREHLFDPRPGTPDRTYLDRAFQLPDEALPPAGGEGGAADRQVRFGREALRRLFASGGPTPVDAAETALVAGTSWTGDAYFEADAARFLGRPAPDGVAALAPDRQLEALARPLGLGGPLLAVDAACASSLYALEAACALLGTGQAPAVAVLGLSAFLPAFLFAGFSKLMALSPAGTILPFSARAAGIVPGEGAGAVLLEPLEAALRAGRAPLGVIRAIGLSADGADRSVFAPGPAGQRVAYERAYAGAGLDPAEVDYLEAHGTATPVGDETEIETADAFFGPARAGRAKLPLGSVKALIGHTLAAAGIASVLKALLILREQTIPPHIPVEPHARLRDSCLALGTAPVPLPPEKGRARRVAISSLGFGGANAHVVIDAWEGPLRAGAAPRASARGSSAAGAGAALALIDFEIALGEPAFPSRFTIDATGLRMGPNLLRRVDPFQLLVTELARRVMARQPGAAGSERTAAVFCTNLGGEMALRLSRRYAVRARGDDPEPAGLPEMTPEAIASALPAMCSGYPALHFDLRAFHETLSGPPGTFWRALALAPAWLGARCRSLLLGAGRRLRPLDDTEGAAEGAGIFLLERLEDARRAGKKVLATIRIEKAAAGAGGEVDGRETSKLDGAPLGEAAGIDALARALRAEGRRAAIEVRAGEAHLFTVLVEKEAPPGAREAAPLARVPVEVRFAPGTAARAPAPAEAPAPPGAPAPAGSAWTAWLDATAGAVHAFFAAQRAALALVRGSSPAGAVAAVPRPGGAAIANVVRSPAGGLGADLVVREDHPYFFDHPLDHVPGTLLVAGALDLAACALREDHFIAGVSVAFRRFCEKEGRTLIELDPPVARGGGGERFTLAGRVRRDGAAEAPALATFEIVARPRPAIPLAAPAAPPEGPPVEPPERRLLHKHRAENVLVGPLEPLGPGEFRCRLIPPPAGHFFAGGDARAHSLLYVLETARQMLMLIAHTIEAVPLGVPMNLLSVRAETDVPVPRDAPLELRCRREPLRRLGEAVLSDVRLALRAPEGEIGTCEIRAQIVDPATYARQRGLAHA